MCLNMQQVISEALTEPRGKFGKHKGQFCWFAFPPPRCLGNKISF
jgi:hypothetical protein